MELDLDLIDIGNSAFTPSRAAPLAQDRDAVSVPESSTFRPIPDVPQVSHYSHSLF
jgi:hypothetical protein